MKFLWLLIVVLGLVAADDSSNSVSQGDNNEDANDDNGADGDVEGRTRGNKQKGSSGNKRFFGGGIPVGHGSGPVGGFGFNQGFGANPAFGGFHGGFGGLNQGFGGLNQGFGGLNQGFGGFNQGFGGLNQGFLAVNPGLSAGFNPVAPPSSCRRWCRTPQGQAYCCENAHQPESLAAVKPGFCPPVRPVCPPTRSFAPPASCSSDGGCGGVDKCCFDTCLQQHTCKPPQGFGR